MKKHSSKLFLTLVLSLPMLLFYLGYLFNHEKSLIPTGFIQYDNVSYVAYGKQYLDAKQFHLQYANPFNSKEYEPIYFQPQSLFFALLLKLGVSPNWILIPFLFFCSLICFWLLISIYDFLTTDRKFRMLHLFFLAWGGGFFVIAGFFARNILHEKDSGIFFLDPENGWWGLNLGRSLFFTCEAYYHAVFIGCIYCLLRNKWLTGLLLLFLLSLSHPFTGIEIIAITLFWCMVELTINKKTIPSWFVASSVLVLGFHLYYYLIYLPKFPDHQSVYMQYTLNWRLRYYRMIPAYGIVGSLAIASTYSASLKKFFANRSNRLFASWFLIAFLLANHEWFVTARQPVHFTRGYIWTSLFLLGLPALRKLTSYLKNRWGYIALSFFAVLFLLDNTAWIFLHIKSKAISPSASYITREQKQLLKSIDKIADSKTLLISEDLTVAYLSAVYTKAYPWLSHPYTTPFAENKKSTLNAFTKKGIIDSSWLGRSTIFVLRKKADATLIYSPPLKHLPIQIRKETDHYLVLKADSLFILP